MKSVIYEEAIIYRNNMLLRWKEQRNGIEASINEEEVGLVIFSRNKQRPSFSQTGLYTYQLS